MDSAQVFDVHCHVHETPSAYDAIEPKAGEGAVVYCVQGTNYEDWSAVAQLKEKYGHRVIPAFGLHPWFVESVMSARIPASWREELKELITKHRGILGECGLDKIARNPSTGAVYPFEPQIGLLKEQLAIAHELNVPVSLHCVRAFGAMVDVLREMEKSGTLPPRIMLHSYSGSPDMLTQMLFKGKLGERIYVSFSHFVNGRNRDKSKACVRAVPASRLLVESDLHNAGATRSALSDIITLVSDARGWPLSKTCDILADNSRAFFKTE
ncbi:Metallo-dependent hydrolase [Martensiomyces pterosporus]|nr:Metallo-dependent hydrolase [Martensiomyces pterosporus]